MPPKKKTTTRNTSRGRSKSAGRSTSKSRARSSSRGRGRSKTPVRRVRTPASESKAKRQHSSSSERSRSPSLSSRLATNESTAQRASRSTASKRLQCIIKKIEGEEFDSARQDKSLPKSKLQSDTKCKCLMMLEGFRHSAFAEALNFILQVTFLLPFALWANLNLFTPATGSPGKAPQPSLWGPTYAFLGVLWPTQWQVYISAPALLCVFSYVLLHFLLARFIPFGRRVSTMSTPRRFDHKCNGVFGFCLLTSIVASSEYCHWMSERGLRPSMTITKHWIGLILSSNLVAIFLSILFYLMARKTVRSTRQNISQAGNILSELYHGRHTRVGWFGVEWKVLLMRSALSSVPLIEMTLLRAQWDRFGYVSPAFSLLVSAHLIQVLVFFVFEHVYLTTYDVQNVTFGLEFIWQRLAMPFICTLAACYLYPQPDVGRMAGSKAPFGCHYYTIPAAIVMFLFGLWVYIRSMSQKDRDSSHPSVSTIETVAGPGTPRFIASGWWGTVRHPDYLGSLLMTYAAVIPCGFVSYIPWLFPLFWTVYLVHRIMVIESTWLKKYGAVWQKYTAFVPSRLVPKIY